MYTVHQPEQTSAPLSIRQRIASYKRALKAEELAELLAVSPITVYKQAAKGAIPSFRVGTAVRFDPKLTSDWLERQ